MRKALVTLLAAGVFSVAAQAQAPSWSGFKAGLSLGYLNYTPTWIDTDFDWWGNNLSYSKGKIAPSVHAGWDTQIGSMVYGVDLEHTFASAKRDVIYDNRANGNVPHVFINNELKSLTTLRGRMGLTAGSTLIYATAGLAKAEVDHSFVNTTSANDNIPAFHNDHTGLVYGFGVEQRLSPLLSLRAEFQRTNIPGTVVTTLSGLRMEVGEDMSAFNFGASFHF